ncbi:hypothetical protein DAPPUDRAFT_238443 [Daphnia pulex]|uniref:Uncharacterized protein n=1 Tax=Daphnia pulex TaxID=6669 RepID=E9G6E9_DAPPU|nr:hypothetical protein DAPPUDRAFT_238443 [Daphnia pulex]|eukprot:EFX84923.1 hypothetical protein DAPPUDRAFT_238443 [Daphnia pulex]
MEPAAQFVSSPIATEDEPPSGDVFADDQSYVKAFRRACRKVFTRTRVCCP